MMASLINVAKVLMEECWKIFKDDFDKQSIICYGHGHKYIERKILETNNE